jgi:hypothetical protein
MIAADAARGEVPASLSTTPPSTDSMLSLSYSSLYSDDGFEVFKTITLSQYINILSYKPDHNVAGPRGMM